MTLEEVELALKELPKNKSPGLDGIPYEFYKDQSNIFAPILRDLFNDQLSTLNLLDSNLIGATRLISKVDEKTAPLLTEL